MDRHVTRTIERLEERMFAGVDGASLAVFRIAFGALLLWDVLKYFRHDWIGRMFVAPNFMFKYYGFEWVEPWPGDGMYFHFAALGVLAFLIMVGLFYRLAATLFLVGFSYVFLLDQTEYLNHFYFVILLNALLVVAPANRAFSLDARFGFVKYDPQVPAWSVWILRAQMEVVLIFAGIVKLNHDWLFRLEPLRMWLAPSADLPLIGPLLLQDWTIAVGAWGAALLHLLGAPLLLWKRTRLWVFLAYCCFHVSNHVFFNIGIFPWLTIAGTLIFFPPDWPRQAAAWASRILALIASSEKTAPEKPPRPAR